MDKKSSIFIAGGGGMVGSALVRKLTSSGFYNLATPSREELNLLDQEKVRIYLQEKKPDIVIVAAAKVGGIWANQTYPAEFLYQNAMIALNLIHESHRAGIRRLLYLGSTCIYPRLCPQPMSEDALLSGPLEKTNEAYAIAKITGVKMCAFYREQYGRDYISAMPTNLYGPNDHYHAENSHVIPGLMRRFHEAVENMQPTVKIWGSGTPKREFLYVDDLAEACLFLLENYHDPMPINIGSNEEYTILQTAECIAKTVGFFGNIACDLSKPDGTPRKKTDLSRLTNLGWRASTSLEEGLKKTYKDYLTNQQGSKKYF